ncbi:MAG: substrate-binding domain-containing protein [Solidesulfovibrio sp.]
MALQAEVMAASLVVYGPGGPFPAIRECADKFGAKSGLTVDVQVGEPAKQAEQAAKDGDVYYTGAEYMMDDFLREYPDILDAAAIIYPAVRRVGIIVRQGNPKGLRTLADLAAPGVRILDVSLENMGGLRGPANANTTVFVTTGRQGLATWKASKDLDAWVTYKTWAEQLAPGEGEFLPIDDARGLRRIPVTVMRNAPHPERARAFLEFLKGSDCVYR